MNDSKDLQLDDDMKTRLRELINQSDVVLFMKGSKVFPQCGFSGQMVQLLGLLNVNYETFDIYKDDEVRQALKIYSNWPTYPQLYVKGELIGGVDIAMEMHESGELEDLLKDFTN